MIQPVFRFYDYVESTNNTAKDEIHRKAAVNGMVIRADYQLSGRGRQGNSWESNRGENLLFTIVFEPENLHPSLQFIINEQISVALRNYLQELIPHSPVKIKWPNDIYVRDKKICGILIEHLILGNTISHTIIGMGINVNQTSFVHADRPTSLKTETGSLFNIDELCAKLSRELLNKLSVKLESFHISDLKKEYEENLYQINEEKKYKVNNESITASIIGVTNEGCLKLKKKNGTTLACELNSVVYL